MIIEKYVIHHDIPSTEIVERSIEIPESNNETESNEPEKKRRRLSRADKKKFKGQNKARPRPFTIDRTSCLCSSLIDIPPPGINIEKPTDLNYKCAGNEKCSNLHDIQAYLQNKPPDILPDCPVYTVRGHCPRGLSCRFGSKHITPDGINLVDVEVLSHFLADSSQGTVNSLARDLQEKLRKKKYDFSEAETCVSNHFQSKKHQNGTTQQIKQMGETTDERERGNMPDESQQDSHNVDEMEKNDQSNSKISENQQESAHNVVKMEKNSQSNSKISGVLTDEDVIHTTTREKKRIEWNGKLYLSPLTTVGNLPFRRICKTFGADITCSEMAMASSLLQGTVQEWALTKRHATEDLYGVQVCGNNPYVMSRCAQLLEQQTNIDFIDINLGCPIELVYNQGSGSGLLRREKNLEAVVCSMQTTLKKLPLTVKTRTGIYTGKNIADKLVPKFEKWGVSLITIHGRSREQRYNKYADWDYVEQCAKVSSNKKCSVFGNGDVLSWDDYNCALKTAPSLEGIMIGRGALIKPWIFTEIKEERNWDISSSERLDILRKYVGYGLEHWGSDFKGVENTRRFLLEWLSFLYRYVPVGLLEHPPQRMNERPPSYRGRDDLETLMASSNCSDWVKISEMLLGPVPDNYNFLPKHKANAWG